MFCQKAPKSLALVFLLFVSFAGCSGSSEPVSTTGMPEALDGLKDLAELLKILESEGRSFPKKKSEFVQHDVMHPAAGTLIPNGTVVYFLGGKIDSNDANPKIVAMQAGADKGGGWVLLSNGELKDLPADQVAALGTSGKPVQ